MSSSICELGTERCWEEGVRCEEVERQVSVGGCECLEREKERERERESITDYTYITNRDYRPSIHSPTHTQTQRWLNGANRKYSLLLSVVGNLALGKRTSSKLPPGRLSMFLLTFPGLPTALCFYRYPPSYMYTCMYMYIWNCTP